MTPDAEKYPIDCMACEDGNNMDDLKWGQKCANCGRKK